jgi:hypothetical protein
VSSCHDTGRGQGKISVGFDIQLGTDLPVDAEPRHLRIMVRSDKFRMVPAQRQDEVPRVGVRIEPGIKGEAAGQVAVP